MVKVKTVSDYINEIAPYSTQCSWDNSGILVGDANAVVNKVGICLDLTEETLQNALSEEIDLIITHHPEDYCSDHRETSKLVFKASFDATVPHFMPECGEATGLAALYYADNDLGVNFVPTEYVDITDEMDTKEKMMACHESQVVWLKEHDGYDIIVEQRKLAASRGTQCGVLYAEGFVPALVSGRLRPYRLLP